jgi:purine nucleoside permease
MRRPSTKGILKRLTARIRRSVPSSSSSVWWVDKITRLVCGQLTNDPQFDPEGGIWYEKMPSSGLGDLLAVNITVPGLSMLYPQVHCLADHSVCQITTGESEINAASSITALVFSGIFDLRKTYFMIGGIAGVNPKLATLGSVALAKYAVQVALQYEFDAREMPDNYSTGYFAYGTDLPNEYPTIIYGTEVFEVNEALRDVAFSYACKATLSDDPVASDYRAKYAVEGTVYAMATKPPSVVKCDSVTSDVYYSGVLLSEAFENVTTVWTNGSGAYCMTAQEDNATLEVMVRAALQGLVDYARIIVMRTGESFIFMNAEVVPHWQLK